MKIDESFTSEKQRKAFFAKLRVVLNHGGRAKSSVKDPGPRSSIQLEGVPVKGFSRKASDKGKLLRRLSKIDSRKLKDSSELKTHITVRKTTLPSPRALTALDVVEKGWRSGLSARIGGSEKLRKIKTLGGTQSIHLGDTEFDHNQTTAAMQRLTSQKQSRMKKIRQGVVNFLKRLRNKS